MPRPKPTPEDLKERVVRARMWKKFRKDYKFSQKKLAEAIGISRRTVQMVESVGDRRLGNPPETGVTPLTKTIRMFEILKKRYEAGLTD